MQLDLATTADLAALAGRVTALEALVPKPTPPQPQPPAPAPGALIGGWKIAAPFCRGSIAVDWSSRTLWLAGQNNAILQFTLPAMGAGTDPTAWPAVTTPIKTIPQFWDTDSAVYANGLAFWQGDLWVSPRKFYDTAPPNTLTLYSLGGKTLTVNLPRQHFSGFVKRLGQDPMLGGGGYESGQGSASGPTLASLAGQVLVDYAFAGTWDQRAPRDPDYWPIGHKDDWYALDPANHGDGTQGRWASDRVYGGGLWLPAGVAYWPYMGTGQIDYALQNTTFSQTTKTTKYVYNPATWQPTWSQTAFGPILGQDFGPNGEVVLCQGNAWNSGQSPYQVDPYLMVLGA